MAARVISRSYSAGLLKNSNRIAVQKVNSFSTGPTLKVDKKWWIVGTLASVTGGVWYALESVNASDLKAAPSPLPWTHKSLLVGFDHASMRRGYEVYKQVCASCHSLQYLAYRHLVGQTHTEEEAKAEAAEMTVVDGPDDTGAMFERPGRLTDYITGPYKNEQEARFANNGAYPPDLSLIVLARKGGEDYIFHLLTNYTDTPAGVKIAEGQAYNPYFPGGAIGMPQVIYDGLVDFADGTPNSASQLAKDVVTFLSWVADRRLEDRKEVGIKALPILLLMFAASWYATRFVFKPIKTTKYQWVDRIRKQKF